MIFVSRLAAVTLAALMCWTVPASTQQSGPMQQAPLQQAPMQQAPVQQVPVQQAPPSQRAPGPATFGPDELVNAGHKFFGNVSRGLASIIERAVSQWGLPNGYVLGEEGSGAFVGGLTYGEGTLYTKNAGDHKVFWQGPSVGWDFGGNGSRIMMLVYDLDDVSGLYGRFLGVAGSAYAVAGLGFNVLKHRDVVLVPIRTGIGARLGVNVGYLKLTEKPTWNPF